MRILSLRMTRINQGRDQFLQAHQTNPMLMRLLGIQLQRPQSPRRRGLQQGRQEAFRVPQRQGQPLRIGRRHEANHFVRGKIGQAQIQVSDRHLGQAIVQFRPGLRRRQATAGPGKIQRGALGFGKFGKGFLEGACHVLNVRRTNVPVLKVQFQRFVGVIANSSTSSRTMVQNLSQTLGQLCLERRRRVQTLIATLSGLLVPVRRFRAPQG
mmetsp:Transcript_13349/g.36820  ORF Transcript_13349/g.36820 Transcript_13349/m.36820 type:complete len:211 (+) Transcript_13349:1091-1723(+)